MLAPRRSWLIAGGMVAAVVVIVWFVALTRLSTSRVSAYRVVDEWTIVVQADGAPRTWTWISEMRETASEVRLAARSFEWLRLPGAATGLYAELTVHLAQPLGGRVVLDEDGEPVPWLRS